MGHTCRKCGNVLDVNFGSDAMEHANVFQPSTSNFVDGLGSEGTGTSKAVKSMPSRGKETVVACLRTWDHQRSFSVQKKEKMGITQSTCKPIIEWKSLPYEGHGLTPTPRQSPYQPCPSLNGESSSVSLKNRSIMLDQMPLRRDRIPPTSTVNNFRSRRVSSAANIMRESKDFVAQNRSVSSRTRPRAPTKMESSKFSHERKGTNEEHESLPHLRSSAPRRTVSGSTQGESRKGVNSTSMKERNVRFDTLIGKGLGLNTQSLNCTCVRSRLFGHQYDNRASDATSSTLNAPLSHKTGGSIEMDKKSMNSQLNNYFQTHFSLEAESIGVLLGQKLKESTSQEHDELAADGVPNRFTAMVLQELISAITAERLNMAFPSMLEKRSINLNKIFRKDHLSPGSVLEASFSSGSLDDSSGHRIFLNSMEYTDDQLQLLERDCNISDSATSLDKVGTGSETVTALLSNVSKILHSMNFAGVRLTESMLVHPKDVILNAELLFREGTSIAISPMFLELETIANAIWVNINVFNGLEATKVENHFVEFIFDSMVECLDLRYGQYTSIGFNAWRRLPLCMTREMMIGVIAENINKWIYLVGMATEEIIEWEISQSQGTWTNFNVVAFETGARIDGDVLQVLVHEIVLDLMECKYGCS